MKVLITGTASGIGKGCAEFFLKENHEVYGFDKNLSTIQHPKYTHFCLDIRDKGSYPEIGSCPTGWRASSPGRRCSAISTAAFRWRSTAAVRGA